MKSYSSREVIRILTLDGWYIVRTKGDHHQFKHPTKKGTVTAPYPRKDIPVRTVKSICKQAAIAIPE